MIFEFGVYKLDIDVERTRRFYETVEVSLVCDCAGCRNFSKAYIYFPEAVQQFYRQFGIHIGMPAEMTAYNSSDGNMTYYDGFYHICGTIIQGKDPWMQVSKGVYQLDDQCALKLNDDFSLFFTEKCALVDKDFPAPVIQMEVRCNAPWVLGEPNPYYFPDL